MSLLGAFSFLILDSTFFRFDVSAEPASDSPPKRAADIVTRVQPQAQWSALRCYDLPQTSPSPLPRDARGETPPLAQRRAR